MKDVASFYSQQVKMINIKMIVFFVLNVSYTTIMIADILFVTGTFAHREPTEG